MATQAESEQLRQLWQERITQWEQTSQSQKAFCDAHDLDYHQFGYWRRRLVVLNQPSDNKNNTAGFAQVVVSPATLSSSLSVALPNGIRLEGVAANNLPMVYQLIERLS